MRTDKHSVEPWGSDNGLAGGKGSCIIDPGTNEERKLPSRFGDYRLNRTNLLRIERPGGGGLGNPFKRSAERVVEDVRQGYVSIDRARSDYGVVVEPVDGELALNFAKTEILRGEKRKTTGIN
jgi:N-methylhydantoinase B/acetone carboxylase, alpha subunit